MMKQPIVSPIFKDLYQKRWKVETFYDELKNKLKIECFFWVLKANRAGFEAIIIGNVQSLIVGEPNKGT